MQGLTDLQNNDKTLTVAVKAATDLIASQATTIAAQSKQITDLEAQVAANGDADSAVEAEAQIVAEQTTALNTAVSSVTPAPAA